jgi:two-component system, NtrC family, sensor histidine kinase HydH
MKRLIRKQDKEGILIMTALSLFLVIILAAGFLFTRMLDQRNDMLMQYTAEQTFSNYLFRVSADAEPTEELLSGSDVVGLAGYTRNGELLLGIGTVPDRFEVPTTPAGERNPRAGRAVYNPENGLIEYSRRTLITFTLGSALTMPEILYIAIDGSTYRAAKIRLYLFYGLFAALIVLFMTATWRMYSRNRAYRETIERQKNLVSLGEAARTLAHEIKNPLSAITLQTAVLKKTLPAAAKSGLETIEEQVRRLNHLAERVREFIRNPVGAPQHIDLPRFIE